MTTELQNTKKIKFEDLMNAGKYFEAHSIPLDTARCYIGGNKFMYRNGKWNLVSINKECKDE